MLRSARCARAPLDPTALREGFLKFDELFHPYTKYCLDQSQCQSYCKEKEHDNELFKAYLAVSFQFPFFSFCVPAAALVQRTRRRPPAVLVFICLMVFSNSVPFQWCETQRDCNSLRLMDILVKPMQRLTKYSLLLKAVHKKTDADQHKPILIDMVRIQVSPVQSSIHFVILFCASC